jgi:NAD(P)-dependent dehydrogenase (short-subunit alcohol dehydrogenase family)
VSRAVLVTGGAKRLGAAFARELAGHGWLPVIHYGSSKDEAEALAAELRGHALSCDLAEPSSVPSLIDRAEALAGAPLWGLVHSASVFGADDSGSVTADALLSHYRVNTVAPVLLAARFAERAREEDGAAVVNVLDQKLWNPNPDHLSYTLSKAALREATVLMAQKLAPKVRVAGVAPGYCLPNPQESDASFEAKAAQHNAMRKRLEPEDIAAAVRFALENKAVTGSVILADNGEHLIPSDRDVVFRP